MSTKPISSRFWRTGFRLVVALLFLVALVGGCIRENPAPDKLILDPHSSGNNQCAMHGEELPSPLQVQVMGPQEKGLLGGKGSRRPCAGAEVRFVIENPETGARFAETGDIEHITRSNAGGRASARLQLGERSADVRVKALVETGHGLEEVNFRATAGVEILGQDLEGETGTKMADVGVRLQNPSGEPAQGVAVYFAVEGNARGAGVSPSRAYTDDTGVATTDWKLGSAIQQYFLTIEIQDEREDVPVEERFKVRRLELEAMAIDKKQILLVLLGGLAIFIFGMRTMSDGLKRLADRRLKSILQAMTRNTLMAVGVGAGLTAIIQSSSATTVMTVGFVNAGLMTLKQAIGVIFGANIGTTITAQIIAFKLNALAFPAIAIGLGLSAFSKRPHVQNLGNTVMGFGLLFLGMDTMSGVLKPLRYSPDFISWFSAFDCTPGPGGMIPAGPALMCILIGTFATVLIQSSSATVGLVLALSSQGLVSFYTAVPLILGDNIGTTITALLASIGANRNARRTALAHTFFNVFGATYMYLLLFVPFWNGQPLFLGFIEAITPGVALSDSPENLLRHVANAHTAFNVFNCIIFLPLAGFMAHVCCRVIPITDADKETVLEYLEPNLLNTPSLALEQTMHEVAYMVRRAQKSIAEACDFFCGGSTDLEKSVMAREEVIDRLQQEITQYLVELSRKQLPADEAAIVPGMIHAVNDAERVGDHSESILELGRILRDHKYELSAPARAEIEEARELVQAQAAIAIEILRGKKVDMDDVYVREDRLDRLVEEAHENHVQRLEDDECDVQTGVVFLDLLATLERVGDHFVNIAERAHVLKRVSA